MLSLNTNNLTKLEREIDEKLSKAVKINSELRIVDAGKMCDVSPSKISKFVRKAGFKNFKQYRLYFSGQDTSVKKQNNSTEINRLIEFLNNFDSEIVDDFLSIIKKYNKIIIYGMGPSFISAEYFGYKLETITSKNIIVSQDEDYVEQIVDKGALVVVFSVTGNFSSFNHLFQVTKNKGGDSILVLEEYNNTLDSSADFIFHLSKIKQNDDLLPFEKTRTIFFIFIEEIIAKLKKSN